MENYKNLFDKFNCFINSCLCISKINDHIYYILFYDFMFNYKNSSLIYYINNLSDIFYIRYLYLYNTFMVYQQRNKHIISLF